MEESHKAPQSIMSKNISTVLEQFGLSAECKLYGNGHINDTYYVESTPPCIVQKLNTNTFKQPVELMNNVKLVTSHIRAKLEAEGGDVNRGTLNFLTAKDGKPYYITEDGSFYRAYIYVGGAHSCDSTDDPMQLYHAAKAFGHFQNMLADFPADQLFEVIPNFHNTKSRYADFKKALADNLSGRADNARDEIKFVLDREADASIVVDDIASGKIPLRVTHNDSKINNVLLDDVTGEGICVIDLDTVMPGSLLYDFGDALRSGGSSGAEDEPDLDKIWFDEAKFEAFAKGFLEVLPSITERELELLPFSVKLMTLECGSRFLADYLNGDTYFKTHYPEHNLVRARTQFKLVADIEAKHDRLMQIVKDLTK